MYYSKFNNPESLILGLDYYKYEIKVGFFNELQIKSIRLAYFGKARRMFFISYLSSLIDFVKESSFDDDVASLLGPVSFYLDIYFINSGCSPLLIFESYYFFIKAKNLIKISKIFFFILSVNNKKPFPFK